MFRTVFSSIIRSLRQYIQHQVYVVLVLRLLASKQPQDRFRSLSVRVKFMMRESGAEGFSPLTSVVPRRHHFVHQFSILISL